VNNRHQNSELPSMSATQPLAFKSVVILNICLLPKEEHTATAYSNLAGKQFAQGQYAEYVGLAHHLVTLSPCQVGRAAR